MNASSKVFIIGCKSGFGKELLAHCQTECLAQGVSREDFNLFDLASVKRLGERIIGELPDVVVFNSYARTVDKEHVAYAQLEALKVLWPMLKPLDLTVVVVGSAIAWEQPNGGNATLLYQRSKKDLAAYCLKNGWLDITNPQHKARMVLFEPATMTNRPEYAKARRTPLLSVESSWALMRGAIASKLPFVRVGAQGGTHVVI